MSDEIEYKGYLIDVTCNQSYDPETWDVYVHIIRRSHAGRRQKEFFLSCSSCQDEDEAIERGRAHGKAIIDGKVADCSVDDL